MGVIFRQSAKSTVVNLAATFMGFISMVFIYPYNFEFYSFFQTIFSNASILLPILGLGIHGTIIKFYPTFVNLGIQSKFLPYFLSRAIITTVIGILIVMVLYWLGRDFLPLIFTNIDEVIKYWQVILFLAIILNITAVFLYYSNAKLRTVIPDLIFNAGIKFALPAGILLSYLYHIDLQTFILWIMLYYVMVLVSMMTYALSLDKVDWSIPKLSKGLTTEMYDFMVYSMLNSIGSALALRIDVVMIAAMLDIKSVGIYSYILTISNVIDLPTKSLNQIAGPVVSQSWTAKNHDNIESIYTKSAILGGAVSMLLFLIIYAVWPYVLGLIPQQKIPDGLLETGMLLLFLGLARTIDILTGVNTIILSYSHLYKYNLYFLIIMSVLNIVMNYFFILSFGILGAAISTLISYLIYNTLKYLFVLRNFHFKLPWASIIAMTLLLFGGLFIVHQMQFDIHPIVGMVVMSVFCCLYFAIGLWILNPQKLIRSTVVAFLTQIQH